MQTNNMPRRRQVFEIPGVQAVTQRLKCGERKTYFYWRETRQRIPGTPGSPEFERELAVIRRKDASRTEGFEYVYFIRSTATGAIKIGKSVDPAKRLNAIQVATSETVELLGCIADVKGGYLERDVQGRFKRQHLRGEWFASSPELLKFISRRALLATAVQKRAAARST